MGRKKAAASSRRKPILQLDDSKSSERSRASNNYDYLTSTSTTETTASTMEDSESQESSGNPESTSAVNVMDSKLANFLQEISALGNKEPEEESAMNDDQQEAENTENNKVQESIEPENMDVSKSSKDVPSTDQPDQVTFWQKVVDPSTNHTYYWDPATNKVSWTLPDLAVIVNDEQGSSEPGEEASDSTYADYYAYYAQTYNNPSNASGNAKTQSTSEQGTGAEQDGTKTQLTQGAISKQNVVALQEGKQSLDSKNIDSVKSSESKASKTALELKNEQPVLDELADDFVGPVLSTSASVPGSSGGLKRKAEGKDEESVGPGEPEVKKARVTVSHGGASAGEEKVASTKKQSSPLMSKQAEQAMRFQVSNLADELSRKLQYLHVSSESLTDLQIIDIQFQTRLADWKEGGLSSKFMLGKLKQFSSEVEQYALSAAPEGWKFVWDSSSCRYKFHNLSTGEITWEYPIQAVSSPVALQAVEEKSQDQEQGGGNDTLEEDLTKEAETPDKEDVCGANIATHTESKMEVTVAQLKVKSKIPTVPSPSTISPAPEPSQQYKSPTAEFLTSSQEGPPLPKPYRRHEEKPPPEPIVAWDLSPSEVRQKLSHSKGIRLPRPPPTVQSTKRIDIFPTTEKTMTLHENTVTGDKGQEFISEFPPRDSRSPSPPPAVAPKPPKQKLTTQEQLSHREERYNLESEMDVTEIDSARVSTSPPAETASPSFGQPTKLQSVPKDRDPVSFGFESKTPTSPVISTHAPYQGESVDSKGTTQAENRNTRDTISPPHMQLPTGELLFSRDPRIAKRQRQQLEQNQGQTVMEGSSSTSTTNSEDTYFVDNKDHEELEESESRLRERLLRRKKYRVRKASDQPDRPNSTDSREDDSQSQPQSGETPDQEEVVHDESIASVDGSLLSTQPPQCEDTVEQSTGEVDRSTPVPAPSVPIVPPSSFQPGDAVVQERGVGTVVMSQQLPESRVEPETGEKETVLEGVGVVSQNEDKMVSVDNTELPEVGVSQSGPGDDGEVAVASDGVDVSMEQPGTAENDNATKTKDGATSDKQSSGVPVGKCYMDQTEKTQDQDASVETKTVKDDKHHSDRSDHRSQSHTQRSSKRKHSHSRSRSPSPDSRHKSSSGRKSLSRRKRDDHSDYERDRYDDSYSLSSSSRRRSHKDHRSRRDRSESSESDDYYRSNRKSSRRHRDYSDSDDDYHSRSLKRSDKDSSRRSSSSKYSSSRHSRRHRHSRSRSRSRSSERDDRDHGRDKSNRHKKKDRKDKKKKRHKSPSKNGSSDEGKSSKPPPNVLVGKVGKVGSVRTLGQDKKADEQDDSKNEPSTQADASNASSAAVGGGTTQAPGSQQMSATFYQQPSTGQVPYYSMMAGTSYPVYPYVQDPYQQQQQTGWQNWSSGGDQQQQQQGQGQQYAGYDGSQQQVYGEQVSDKVETKTDGDGTTDQTQTQSQPQSSSHAETVEMDIGEEDQINECEMDIEESTTEESVKVVVVTNEAPPSSELPQVKENLEPPVTAIPISQPIQDTPSVVDPSNQEQSTSITTSPTQQHESVTEPQQEARGDIILESSSLSQSSETTPHDVVIVQPTKETSQTADLAQNQVQVTMPTEAPLPLPPSGKPSGTSLSVGDKSDEMPLPPGDESSVTSSAPPPPGTVDIEATNETTSTTTATTSVCTNAYTVPSDDEDTTNAKTADSDTKASDTSKTGSTSTTGTTGTTGSTPSGTRDDDGTRTPPLPASYTSAQAGTPMSYYPVSSTTGATTPVSGYSYASYGQPSSYAYNYGQGYGEYAQAYSAYIQQAAAAATYGAYSGQYYPSSYGMYGSPYAAYYNTGGTGGYNTAASYQMAGGQQAYASTQGTPTTSVSTTDPNSATPVKKSEFALSGSKEKQMKNMMEKWSSFKEGTQ